QEVGESDVDGNDTPKLIVPAERHRISDHQRLSAAVVEIGVRPDRAAGVPGSAIPFPLEVIVFRLGELLEVEFSVCPVIVGCVTGGIRCESVRLESDAATVN